MKSHASMNRIYRLVWNAALGIWVAVAENAKGRGKSGRAASALLSVLALLSPSAYAADAANASVVSGAGSVATSGLTTTINQTSQRLAIDWTQLSTAANEALRFNQPNAQAIALNRIIGSSPSSFLGSLTANGQVFILNPNGVLFGAGSQVNVGGLVASTLAMSNADFMAGRNVFTNSGGTGSVVNKGSMTAASGGYLALLAPEVRNEGIMTASLGTALLAAGNKVTLNLDNGSLLGYSIDQGAINALAENKQLIKADGGQVLLSAKALDALTTATVNNTGVIEARTIQNKAGRILLMGDMEHGTVNVGGTLDASAPSGGDGGFIETSAAHVNVAVGTKVTTRVANGKTGKWLIDPNDFTIAASGGNMDAATVVSNLASTDFEIQTATMGTTGSGDINVNEALSWSSANTLTLTAQRNININQAITATSGGLTLNAANQISAPAAVNVGTFTLANGTWSQLGTLPAFSASDFRINGGTFIRALGGDGLSAGSAYQIADIYGLQGADSAGMLDKNYQLANNIDASGTVNWNNGAGFNPIGDSRPGHYFTGNLAGLGRTINNLTIYRPNSDYVGLFGFLGDPLLGVYQPGTSSNASNISNVGLVGGSVTGRAYVGSLVGSAFYGMITNSYASTTVAGISGSAYADSVGGLVGAAEGMQIRYSYATGNVTGGIRVGGLVGDFFNGRLMDSYASGEVRGVAMVGGLAGRYGSAGTGDPAAFGLIRSHATGDVIGDSSGSAYVGGLVGSTEIANFDLLTALYATGQVSGGTYVGGLIGLHSGGQFNNGYATGKVTATGDFVGGLIGLFEELGPSELGYVTASGNVRGANQVGGLIGGVGFSSYSRVGNIYEAYASGNVSGASHVGGLVGELNSGSVSNAYSTGDVSGTDGVGGLVGYNQKNISLSYASGAVTGTSNVGGLVGINPGGGTVTSSYWDTTTTGQSGSAGGVGLANSAAYSQASYSGLDLANVWYLKEGYTRPILRSEYTTVIRNAHQLQLVNLSASTLQSSYGYKLANDIDMSGLTRASDVWNTATGFVPLGDATTAFTGSFDGQNHTISNLFINRPTQDNVGLFGVTGSSANIRNLGLVDGSVTGNSSVGALVGRNQGRVSNSYATADVTGGSNVGALVGENSGSISNAYSTGGVTGGSDVGGLVGENSGTGTVSNSYSNGKVNDGVASSDVGGLVGTNFGGSVSNNFWDMETSGQTTSAGGIGKTTAEMQQASTFTGAGWSASNVGGDGKTWRVYDGQTGPLLRSFLTPLNLTPVFDGTASSPANIGAYTMQGTPDSTKLLGPVASASDTLTLSNAGTANEYIATVAANRYSHQQGYDLITHRVITTPGSTAGDVKLDNNISFANGALAMSSTGNIDLNGKAITGSGSNSYLLINGGTAINAGAVSVDSFVMFDGTWNQSVTTLPGFAARDFTIFGGTFIRAKGGDGSATPYQIADVYGLQGAGSAGMLGKNYTLANNIDASGTSAWNNLAGFNPIGDGNLAFSGSFDGNNKTITGLSIDRATTDYVGLFGAASTSATVSNVGLVGGNVAGNSNVGALVGDNHGSISGSYASTNVTGAGDTTGGLIGFNSGAIDNSYAAGVVTGHTWVGGLLGQSSGAVSNSHATGVVNGDNSVGGLVGQNNSGGVITNSYATTGQVTATGYYAGGLIGYNASGGSAVNNSYATRNVTGLESVGGLVGYTEATAITNSYATGRVIAARRTAGGLVGEISSFGSPMDVVSNSYSTGDVSGPAGVGGLVGESDGGISNSYSIGNVTGNTRVGGLMGTNHGSISNSYSTGNITGNTSVGGLVGSNVNGSINNSYSTGNVNNSIASSDVGGLVGKNSNGSVTDSFWNTDTSGQATSALGTGISDGYMKEASTFTNWSIASTGGSSAVWRIYAGYTSPLLRSFLTPLLVQPSYDGSGAALNIAGSLALPAGTDMSKISGSVRDGTTLTLTSNGLAGSYTASASTWGLYSGQQGYDMSSAVRTISTPGSAVGDIKLGSNISFTDGTLTMFATGYIDLNGKAITASGSNSFLQINGGTAINAGAVSVDSFLMMDGTWSQVAPTLPGFAARDFSLWGGTFIRAKTGDGGTLTPYQIADVYGLQGVDSVGMAGKHYKLANNIDASGTAAWNSGFGFNPIGTVAGSFTGTFDGMGHAISGLSIDRPGTDLVGLFRATSGSAAIRNVGLVGGSVKGHNDVGALVGRNQTSITGSYASTDVTGFVDVGGLVGLSIYGSISDSHADGVVNGAGSVGGLVGYSLVSAISHSYATGNVIGRDYVGGLIGQNGYYNTTGSISDSYATGNVTGRHRLGGLVGGHLSNTITNSYATGTVNGSGSGIGGLVGELSYATISNSYYGTGSVTGSSDTGGLVGSNDSGVVTNSFWDKQTSSQTSSAGSASSAGKTSAEMMQAATFTGWDMASAGGSTHIWRIYEGNAGHVGPLLRSFLTAKALTGTTLTYNGATQSDAFTLTAGIYGNVASGRNAGTYTSSLYSDQTGYDLSGSGTLTIDKANVVVKAGDVTKTYDGGLSASGAAVAASGTQLFTTDTATGGSFAFIDKNAGLGNKTVTVSGVTVNDGNSGNNYNVSYVDNTTSTITPKALTVSGLTASNKTYDQGTSATVSTAGALYTGLIGGDAVSVSATGAFTDKNAATGKTVNVTSGYTGADVHNYAITNQTTTTADIAQKALSVSAITAANKVYDQGTGASVNTAGAVLGGLMAGDAVTVSATGLFIDKHVATGKTVNLSSNYTGADVGNYTITSQASTAASITQKALTVSGVTAGNKLYDRTTSAVVSTAGAIYGGLIGGDDLSVGSTGGFTDKNAADGKTVILSSSYTGADVGNYFITDQATTTANVTPKALTISGVTAGNKVYDGHTGAQTNSLFAAYGGLIVGDAVTVSSSGVFDSKNAASGKTVILASGYTGADVGNYVITDQAFAAANITPKALTVSGITVANKTYDQGTGATVSTAGAVYGGLIAGDVLAVNATGIFLDKHAANGKTVNLSSNYTGADVNNYAITDQASTSANITQKALTIWGVTASNKVYDQGVGATVSAVGAVYSGLIGGDALTVSATGGFLDKNAANGKSVNLTSGYTGADVGNYAITNQATTTANITPKDLSVTAAAQHKTYDATPVATLAYTDNRIAGDSLSFSSSASFIDKNVGTAKTVYFSSLTQTGTDAGNYTLASPTSGTSHANITPAALLITANNDSRQAFAPYSGGNGVVYNGLVGGETASVLAGALTYGGRSQGASAAGTYAIKPGGQASSNYTITFTNGTLTLTPASAAASALGGSALSDAYISVLVNVAGVGKSSGSGDDSAAAAALDSAAEE